MRSFQVYLQESKNSHLEHLEDLILNRGSKGALEILGTLQNVFDMLQGNTNSSVDITTKFDGSPAIICGTNPENRRFFVATKSAFAKSPKLCYTPDDVSKHYSGDLAEKLKMALEHFPKLGIKGILQGDLMFTKSSLKVKNILGIKHVTFQPNTILYAVPVKSDLAKTILTADIGVVFHTEYTGNTIQGMKASFNPNLSQLKPTPSVWVQSADYRDISGSATFTADQSATLARSIGDVQKNIRRSSKFLDKLQTQPELIELIKRYINANVRDGIIHGDPKSLIQWITKEASIKSAAMNTWSGKTSKYDSYLEFVDWIKANESEIVAMFELQKAIVDAKSLILKKLQEIQGIGTFLKVGNSYQTTTPEGFVAIDRLSNSAVKLVDRLEFSRANFLAVKSWG